MHTRSFFSNLLQVLGLVFVLSPLGHAVMSNRIASAITEARTPLQGTVSPRVKNSIDLGAAHSTLKLEGLTMRFNMTAAQQAALSQLLIDQQNPSSPRYHQWLTSQQFGTQFGLSADDISKVSSWLTAQGFTLTGVANSSTFITFSGTTAQVQRAFGTTIHSLSVDGQTHIANLTEPTLPSAIASVVGTITGLNDFKLKPRLRTRQLSLNAVHPQYTVPTTNGTEHFISPADFDTIYNLNPLLTNSTNGAGIVIAVMGQVDISPYASDIAAFRSVSGLSANPPTIKTYGTSPGAPSSACLGSNPPTNCRPSVSDLDESLLDVEWAGAAAPGASILFVNSTDVIDTSLANAIDDNLAPIMTVSYGACENAFYAEASLNTLNLLFEQANAKGITIFAPAGDDGATDCDVNATSATQGLTVDFPASSPYVTGLGGTTFSEGTGTYWNANNATNGGSATTYIPETVWNETTADLTSSSPRFGATGGGASAYFAKPAWQSGPGVPNDSARDVPDIALNASAAHDGYLVCVLGSCVAPNYYNAQGNFNVFGGTSVAAPSFAGIMALVEQKFGGGRLGNINPVIYALANSPSYNSIFHDVTSGNNNSPCSAGSTNCPNGGSIGYTAGTGYDQATGWGSVDASVLASSWTSVTPITGGQVVSQTTVTASPASAIAGTAISLTISVVGNPASSPPTGMVQIQLDGTTIASSSTQLTAGSATYSLSTTGLASGTHAVTAVYSGDTNFNSSKGTVSIDITSASTADFTITPSTASTTAKAGGSASGVVFTLAPVNGFTGSITMSASTNQALAAGYIFSVNPVAITSTTGVPTTFTLSAFQSNSNAREKVTPLKLASNHPPSVKVPWYITGSGATLACIFLLVLPRPRQWGALLAVILSVSVIGAVGCGSSSTTNTPSNPSVTNSTPGTYNITITATAAGNLTHSATVAFIVN